MDLDQLKKSFRTVSDFPKKGIVFRDITTVVKKPECMNYIIEELYEKYKDKGITKVVGIESRGFIFAPVIAYKLNAGFVPMRKKSKGNNLFEK